MQIKYSSYLRHASEPYTSEAGKKILSSGNVTVSPISGGKGGNPNHDAKTGQFTFGSKTRIASKIAQGGKNAGDIAYQYVDKLGKGTKGPRADLSNMSDEELRKILNREEMERRYDTYFNTPTERKGVEYVKTALTITTGVLGVAGAALGAAATIQGIVKTAKGDKK